jgi:acetolactate synthase I/III small subunit
LCQGAQRIGRSAPIHSAELPRDDWSQFAYRLTLQAQLATQLAILVSGDLDMTNDRSDIHHHILSVLVQNRPGVLARVASLFARRGYNIFSLAVAPAEQEGMSRITIVVDLESTPLEQIVKQLFKLIDVVKISELDPRRSVERELLLATVRVQPHERGQVIELSNIFEGKILAVGADALTLSLEGHPDKLDDFEELLGAYNIMELQRTGRVALPKLDRPTRLRVAN